LAPPGATSVAIIMGSQADWQTMKHAAETLDALGVPYDARIVSAHRTPERLYAFAKGAKAAGFQVIIAGAGGAAHLPGMTAALTSLPVFGVPIESKALSAALGGRLEDADCASAMTARVRLDRSGTAGDDRRHRRPPGARSAASLASSKPSFRSSAKSP
jgi:hypothetical protein